MRSTFNILFYVNKSKEKNGMVPVMGRVTINGTQSQFSCKKTIPLDMWDVKGNCAKGRSKEALQINRELDNIKAQIIKHYQHLSDREAFVTAEMVRNSYQGFGSEYETLLSAFDKDIANQKKRVGKDRSASTLWAMERSRKDVADFIQSHYRRTDMSMLELTPEFIKDFAAYLSTDRGLANGTIWQRCMWLKGVVQRAHYNGKIPRNPFAQFHISPNCKEREFLTDDEIPSSVAKFKFYYTGGSSTFSPKDGYGCVNSKQTEIRTVADGVTTFDIFTLPHTEDDMLTKLTVTALDANDNTIKERIFENVPVTRNQITRYTGSFFSNGGSGQTSDGTFRLTADPDWDSVNGYTF